MSKITEFIKSYSKLWNIKAKMGQRFSANPLILLAERTGLEPATPGVTGRTAKSITTRDSTGFEFQKHLKNTPLLALQNKLYSKLFRRSIDGEKIAQALAEACIATILVWMLFFAATHAHAQSVPGETPWRHCGAGERNAPVTGECIPDPICKSGRAPDGVCRPAPLPPDPICKSGMRLPNGQCAPSRLQFSAWLKS